MDSETMLSVLRSYPNMLKSAAELGEKLQVKKEQVEGIAVCGMGGSGFAGDLLSCYLDNLDIPVYVFKNYDLPKYITRKHLVFTLSYSGNTEETISNYRFATKRGIKTISISSGGKLEELSKLNKNPHIKIPHGIQPRLATPYLFIPMLNLLSMSGLIAGEEEDIKKTIKSLSDSIDIVEKAGKQLAQKIKGKVPIIYASDRMLPIAEKWKTDINENAKTHAFYNYFPEFNHNEICGYTHPNGNFYVVILSDLEDNDRIKMRIAAFKKVVRKYNTELTEIAIKGEPFLTRLFSTILMGTYLGYFLALEYNIDPTPVDIIENFKKEISGSN